MCKSNKDKKEKKSTWAKIMGFFSCLIICFSLYLPKQFRITFTNLTKHKHL